MRLVGIAFPANGERTLPTVVAGVVDDRDTPADGFGEDAVALQQRGHRRDDRAADGLALALIVGKEERPILPYASADTPPNWLRRDRVSPDWWTRRSCGH